MLTRPLGASFADWVAVAHRQSGLGRGTGVVTLGLSTLILVLVLTLALGKGRSGTPRAGLPNLAAEE